MSVTDYAKLSDPELWPVYMFRPLPDALRGDIYRYADGKWIKDDGQPDLAFASPLDNTCLYVSLPCQRNIVLSWTTGHWAAHEPRHPRGNAWHYALREGKTDWGGAWDRESHENSRAGRSGVDFVCRQRGSCGGSHIEMNPKDKHILAGLVFERDTRTRLVLPKDAVCMYCGDSPVFEGGV